MAAVALATDPPDGRNEMPAIVLYAMLAAAQRAAEHEEQRRRRDRWIRDDDRKPESWPGRDARTPLKPLVQAIRAAIGLVPAVEAHA
jgi:hypothetical protein